MYCSDSKSFACSYDVVEFFSSLLLLSSILFTCSRIFWLSSFSFNNFLGVSHNCKFRQRRFSCILIVSAVTGVELSFGFGFFSISSFSHSLPLTCSSLSLVAKFNHYTKYTDVIIPKMICSKLHAKRKVFSYEMWKCHHILAFSYIFISTLICVALSAMCE